MSFSFSSSPDDATPIPHQGGASSSGNHSSEVERDMLAEARLLRQHKTRLEARMKILEEHNRQLETQLSRLRQLLDEVCLKLIPFHLFGIQKNLLNSLEETAEKVRRRQRQERCRPGQSPLLTSQPTHPCGPMDMTKV